jgi:hypothetical protein
LKSSSKWLAGFGVVIGALVILAVVLVLTLPGEDERELPPENTPEGVVTRYLKAVEAGDYETVYGYLSRSALAENRDLDTFEEWVRYQPRQSGDGAWKATITGTREYGEYTEVVVEISRFEPEPPFPNPVYSNQEVFILEREDGNWAIQNPLYIPWEIRVDLTPTRQGGTREYC